MGGGGVTIMQIRGHGGITHFANSEGRGELKYGSRPWYGVDIFWNCQMQVWFQRLFTSCFSLFCDLSMTFCD